MISTLTHEEESYLRHFLAHRGRERQTMQISAMLLLLFGGLLIIGAIVFLLQHLSDEAVILVGMPAILAGLVLIVLYAWTTKRERESKKLLAILSKLLERT